MDKKRASVLADPSAPSLVVAAFMGIIDFPFGDQPIRIILNPDWGASHPPEKPKPVPGEKNPPPTK